MWTSYLNVALRNMRKHKGHAFVNIAGSAIGITAGLLILVYVAQETSYDDFHTKGDRIYRVQYDFVSQGETVFQSATTFPSVGPLMVQDFP